MYRGFESLPLRLRPLQTISLVCNGRFFIGRVPFLLIRFYHTISYKEVSKTGTSKIAVSGHLPKARKVKSRAVSRATFADTSLPATSIGIKAVLFYPFELLHQYLPSFCKGKSRMDLFFFVTNSVRHPAYTCDKHFKQYKI